MTVNKFLLKVEPHLDYLFSFLLSGKVAVLYLLVNFLSYSFVQEKTTERLNKEDIIVSLILKANFNLAYKYREEIVHFLKFSYKEVQIKGPSINVFLNSGWSLVFIEHAEILSNSLTFIFKQHVVIRVFLEKRFFGWLLLKSQFLLFFVVIVHELIPNLFELYELHLKWLGVHVDLGSELEEGDIGHFELILVRLLDDSDFGG